MSYNYSQYTSSNGQQQPVAWWHWDDPLAESSVNLRAMRATECMPQNYPQMNAFSHDLDPMNGAFANGYYDSFSNSLPGTLARSLSMTDLNSMDGIGDLDLTNRSSRTNNDGLGDISNSGDDNEADGMTSEPTDEAGSENASDNFQCPCCGNRCEGGLAYHAHVANCYMQRFLPTSSPADISNVIASLSPRSNLTTTTSDQVSPIVTPTHARSNGPTNFTFSVDNSATRVNQAPMPVVPLPSSNLPISNLLALPTHPPSTTTSNVSSGAQMSSAPNASANDALAAMFLLRTCVSQLDLHQRISLMSSLFQLSRSTANSGDSAPHSSSPSHVDEKVISLLYSPAPNVVPTTVGPLPPLSELNLDTHPSTDDLEE